jgi:hypothetical protein
MMAQQFESVNADPLGRLQYDPSLMQEVDIPFRLRERE